MAETKNFLNEENGSVNISDEVLASIAGLAAVEVDGVAALTAGGVAIAELLGKKSLSKGVKISYVEEDIIVDLFVTVKYGAIVPTVALAVQDAVANALESMAGVTAKAINIHVTGVCFDKPAKKKNAEENK